MLIIDPLKTFNNVIEYYREVLSLIPKLYIGMSIESFTKESEILRKPNHYISSIQAIFFNKSLKIQSIEDLIKDTNIDDTRIDAIFKSIDSFKELQSLVPMSQKEKCKQLRNCLAHSMFEIRIHNEDSLINVENVDNISIYINNGKISGTISYHDFYQLEDLYAKLYGELFPNKVLNVLDITYKPILPEKLHLNNDADIKKFVNNIKIKNSPMSAEKNLF